MPPCSLDARLSQKVVLMPCAWALRLEAVETACTAIAVVSEEALMANGKEVMMGAG